MSAEIATFDCEFTLALNNRTGKYFFCKEMIESSPDLIAACLYWRFSMRQLPSRMLSRMLGRLARWEAELRSNASLVDRLVPPTRHRRPMIFTDPRECIFYQLKSCDVVLCHDMGPITHPGLYHPGVSELYQTVFDRIRAARPFMLFVSDASRTDFVARCGDDYPHLDVVHPPLRMDMRQSDELRTVDGIPERFFLTVGAIGERKNQLRAIQAFEQSGLSQQGYAYVVCGGPEPGAEPVVERGRRTQGVILPGYVGDAELRWLYKNAAGFVLPSLLEGFGLPAAEAIHHGLVPLLSRGGALQEVAGDGAIYVDPLDIGEMAAAMSALANLSNEDRKSRLERMSGSVGRFSLENATARWRKALALAAQAKRQSDMGPRPRGTAAAVQ
ncbi:glycosyltransferase family 4 protein [Bradyrhizobium sp.]|uniref:glycosyltransferase family 4 protein n=1 Tax=Bradyrhizobium sp. TaxID=376 RepID=UPI003C6031A0